MDLTDLNIIKSFCKKYGVRPSKEFGQNFLIDREVLETMVEAADLKRGDVILEIGPGFGVLTAELVKRVSRVIAVEADRKMANALREIMADFQNVEIIQDDVLKFSIFNFQFSNNFQNSKFKIQNYSYKIVANLPYQITSAVFRKFLSEEPRPNEITVMVQKEVAERICAKPGEMSLLSLSVQFYGQPEIVAIVPRRVFWPEPEVDSAILKISNIRGIFAKNEKEISPEKFFRLAKIGFSARRKQLQNNLAGGLRLSNKAVQDILIKIGLDPKVRAQDLAIEDWIRLINNF
ncbi:ribosomal RNA small subunit methyltransferase A [Candidatus Falkowbacteria bacterium]|nr:ribosomal RNA small subunit methyltransferase A [Candidatus Falkowbacteria bacterium]